MDFLWDAAANLLDGAIGNDELSKLRDLLTFTGSNYQFTQFWDIVNELLEIVTPFGFAMITTWFLIHMFDAASKDQISIDSIIKTLIQLVLAVALVGNLTLIVNSFLKISETMFSSIALGDNTVSINGAEIVEIWKANSPGGWLGALWDAFLLNILSTVSSIAIQFAALSRMLEMAWRIVFAPIGCSNVFEGGASSPGVKYLKSLFGVIISSVALYVVAATGYSLSSVFLTSGETSAYEILANADAVINYGADAIYTTVQTMNNSLLTSGATLLATAGAAIGISNKIKEVVG